LTTRELGGILYYWKLPPSPGGDGNLVFRGVKREAQKTRFGDRHLGLSSAARLVLDPYP